MDLLGSDATTISAAAATVGALVLAAIFLVPKKAAAPPKAPPKPKEAAAARPLPNGPLTILWGSQTGTAERFGDMLMREARQRGYDAKSVDLEEFDTARLAEERSPVVFLMATHGEGEPTDNAHAFYGWLNGEAGALPGVRFAAFALGNRQYEHFCFMGRWVDERMASLGAERFCELGEGDDDDDLEGDFEKWRGKLWAALPTGGGGGGGGGGGEVPSNGGAAAEAPPPAFEEAPPASFDCAEVQWSGASSARAWLQRAFPKQPLTEVRVQANYELTADASLEGSVRHIELAVGGAAANKPPVLRYAAADDLAVCCDNGPALAAEAAALLGVRLDAAFALRPKPGCADAKPPLPTPATYDLALRHHVDLRAPLPKPVLLLLAAHTAEEGEAARLRHLASAAGRAEYSSYVQRDGRGLLDVLKEFRSATPPWADLVELMPKLTPRYYTISSSPSHDAATLSLTVKVVREPMRDATPGRTKVGVCSTQLEGLGVGDTAIVFVRPSAFRIPRDPAVPLVMVGPGTGVAPFRAFVQELAVGVEAQKKRSAPARLYFGCRREAVDFLYADELKGAVASGALAALRLAFSRDDPGKKVYVQQRVREDGAELWKLLGKEGGHAYICGGTSMGRDVVAALAEVAAKHGGLAPHAAAAFVKQMTADGRLVQELWS